jgi:hypothetical protein
MRSRRGIAVVSAPGRSHSIGGRHADTFTGTGCRLCASLLRGPVTSARASTGFTEYNAMLLMMTPYYRVANAADEAEEEVLTVRARRGASDTTTVAQAVAGGMEDPDERTTRGRGLDC